MSWSHISNLLKGGCIQFQALYVRGYMNSSVKKVRINKQPGRFLSILQNSKYRYTQNLIIYVAFVTMYITQNRCKSDSQSIEIAWKCVKMAKSKRRQNASKIGFSILVDHWDVINFSIHAAVLDEITEDPWRGIRSVTYFIPPWIPSEPNWPNNRVKKIPQVLASCEVSSKFIQLL